MTRSVRRDTGPELVRCPHCRRLIRPSGDVLSTHRRIDRRKRCDGFGMSVAVILDASTEDR